MAWYEPLTWEFAGQRVIEGTDEGYRACHKILFLCWLVKEMPEDTGRKCPLLSARLFVSITHSDRLYKYSDHPWGVITTQSRSSRKTQALVSLSIPVITAPEGFMSNTECIVMKPEAPFKSYSSEDLNTDHFSLLPTSMFGSLKGMLDSGHLLTGQEVTPPIAARPSWGAVVHVLHFPCDPRSGRQCVCLPSSTQVQSHHLLHLHEASNILLLLFLVVFS